MTEQHRRLSDYLDQINQDFQITKCYFGIQKRNALHLQFLHHIRKMDHSLHGYCIKPIVDARPTARPPTFIILITRWLIKVGGVILHNSGESYSKLYIFFKCNGSHRYIILAHLSQRLGGAYSIGSSVVRPNRPQFQMTSPLKLLGHVTKMAAMHIFGKALKNFFSRTNRPMTLKLSV